MARKWLSVRDADLQRQLASATSADPAVVADIDRRAMILDWERHQKRNSLGAVMVRLRQRFNERRQSVTRSRAMQMHDKGVEHPSLSQWQLFLSSDDFTAFVLYSLRIDTTDTTSQLPVARWLLQRRRDADMTPVVLASLFRDCAAAAIDEWQQIQRHGKNKPQAVNEAEETAAIIAALTEAAESLERVDGAGCDSMAG